jgi:glycosyltransferase involved in cell wall biosynthesis
VRICILSLASRVHGIGGLQDHTTDLARGLQRSGHDVEVISAAHPDGIREEDWDGIHWRFVDAPPTWFGDRRWLAASYDAYRATAAARPFDVVHGQGSGGLGLVLRGVHRETPFVEMFHGNYLGLVKAAVTRMRPPATAWGRAREVRHVASLTRRHFAHRNARAFRECEAIVPSVQQLADTCRSHRLDPARVHVVRNGVDTAMFAPRPRDGVRALLGLDDAFRFICVGRLNREKGVQRAIAALAELRREGIAAKLLVVGDGEERPALEALSASLGVDDAVEFVGAQTRSAVAAYLSAADVFVFPTERDEAAPLVLPQALASGTPVIATRRGGIPEVLDRPGENGLLVEPADDRALVAAMRETFERPELRAGLSANGLRRVAEAYTLERMVEDTLAVYAAAQTSSASAAQHALLRTRRAGLVGAPLVLHRVACHSAALGLVAHHLHL